MIRNRSYTSRTGNFCSWSCNKKSDVMTAPRPKQRQLVKPPLQLQKWYTAIFGTNPRCAHPSCLRLLPSPRTVRSENSKGTMAVGANDLRVGSKEVRSFISSNRGVIYSCLVSIDSVSRPNFTTYFLLVHFGHPLSYIMYK
jgi:hypothetical protein